MRVLRKIRSNTSLTIEQDDPITIATPTFHESIRFALVMAQIFGIMPLYGTTVATTKKLQDIKFEWVSLKMVFALFHIIGTLAAGVFCMLKMALHGFVIDETAIMVFYMMNGFCAIHYIYLAAKWRTILKEWTCVEISMKSYRNAKNVKRINIFTTVVFMFFGIIEHTLYILSAVQTASKCDNFKKHPVEIYFGCSFPHYFTLLSYNHWAAAVVEFSNFLATFTWNFTDLFIILISISLREKFNQISDKIRQSKNVHDKFWKTIREDHLKVSNLTRAMDSHIAAIVLFSFINNIFFLCIQLYNSIKERTAVIDSIYFFYSFGFIAARVAAVSLYSATLNEAARRPVEYLYSLPTENYTLDVSRLITQINYMQNGITGHGFFLITKNFLLQAAATVITFELMIFQFAPSTQNKYNVRSEAVCIK